MESLIRQSQTLTLSSRAFYNDQFGKFAEYITKYFGMDMVLPMNTGAEAVETAMKLARRWAYVKKGVPEDEAMIFACTNNFHGRTISIISMSTDPDCRRQFGPFVPNIGAICPSSGSQLRHGHIEDLELALNTHGPKVAAFIVEPIQGEAGYARFSG